MKKAHLRTLIRCTIKPLFHPWVPFKLRRLLMHSSRLLHRKVAHVNRSTVRLGGCSSYCVAHQHASHLTLLYLHGGGYVFGGVYTHKPLVDNLAATGKCKVVMPNYRLAPEYPFPAALHDALACYKALLEQGTPAEHIVVAGDSAGGGLALALALQLKANAIPQPRALVLLSPWVDLTLSGASITERRQRDPMLLPSGLASCARAYCQTTELNNPLCSPLFADLTDLPPLIIQVGTEEILFSDAHALHKKARAANVKSSLSEFSGMWHDFQLHSGQLAESNQALNDIFANEAVASISSSETPIKTPKL